MNEELKESPCCGGACGAGVGAASAHKTARTGHGFKNFVLGLVGLFLAAYLSTLIASNVKAYHDSGKAPPQLRTIMVNGAGKITATPTIAATNVGLVTDKADVASAQTENSQKMNALIAALEKIGIAEQDIKTTQYEIYPKYSYDPKGGSTIIGYSVTQSVTVKIRDLTKISEVLATAGQAGANSVGGIAFTIDDPKVLQAQAREDAVKDARMRAEKLADELGVRLGRVMQFAEDQGQGGPVPYSVQRTGMAMGGGGDAAPPQVQSGTIDVVSNVSITYEIE